MRVSRTNQKRSRVSRKSNRKVGGRRFRFTEEQVAMALRATRGLKSHAARRLKCDPSTITHYFAEFPGLQKVCKEIIDETLDLAESKLWEGVKEGDKTSIIFTLKTLGKHRGYSERYEVTGADGAPIKSEVKHETTVNFDGFSKAFIALLQPPSRDQNGLEISGGNGSQESVH